MASKKGKASKPVYPENKPSKKEHQESGKGKTNNPNPKHRTTTRKK